MATIAVHKRRFEAYDDRGTAYPLDVYVNVATVGGGPPRTEIEDTTTIVFPTDDPYVRRLAKGRYWVKAIGKLLTSNDPDAP